MSVKKDRFGKRRYRNAKGHCWNVPKRWLVTYNRQWRSKVKQAMREGKYDSLPLYIHDAGWLYW